MDFLEMVRLERELFPGVFEKELIDRSEGAFRHWFSPSYHFSTGLMNEEIVEDLKEGKRLLSVGAGAAHLETFLVEALKVPQERIVLADRDAIHGKGFKTHNFDMYQRWPSMGEFDYIVFPRSVFISPTRPSSEQRNHRSSLNHLVSESFERLNVPGQIRMSGYLPSHEDIDAQRSSFTSVHKNTIYKCLKAEDFNYSPSHPDLLIIDKN
jgi:hypothetical protein